MTSINPIYLTTSIIFKFKDNEQKGSATGFFFIDKSKKLYLVTNKHVIYGEKYYLKDSAPEINRIELRLHTNSKNLSENEGFKVPLFSNKTKIWLEHNNPEIDVVLIPLNLDTKKFIMVKIDETAILNVNSIVIDFEKIFILGYPYGWYDNINNLPIIRVGHLSSPFKAPFQNKPLMLGDVETHNGMSGGPVFMKLEDFVTIENGKRNKHLGSTKIILVGVHSGQPRWNLIDNITRKIKENIPHSLVYIWFSDLILDILRQNHTY